MTESVAVIIPTYNEQSDIDECIEAVAAQDVGVDALELVIVDGGSQDGTIESALAAARRHPFARVEVVDNPDRRTAAGLHRALAAVTAPYVVRVDARSRIGGGHVRRATTILAERPDVGVAGGAQVPIAPARGTMGAGIARALSNRYTTGLSRYRRSRRGGPADTVWMGSFRTSELRGLGGWDPSYGVNEDYELNQRYRSAGYLVWFDPEMEAGYIPRRHLGALGRQYYAYGQAKGAQWTSGGRPSVRHVVLLAAPPVMAAAAIVAIERWGLARTAVVAMAGALVVDHVGSRPSRAGSSVRLASVLGTATFQLAWWAGVVTGAIRAAERVMATKSSR